MRTLIAGPWVGEFGWELISWQGWVRARSEHYDRVVVSAPAGHEALYETATVFVPHNMSGKRDCWRLLTPNIVEMKRIEEALTKYPKCDRLLPGGYVKPQHQKFIKLGDVSCVVPEQRYDVLLHLRGAVGKRSYHAWNVPDAAIVARGLSKLKIGCIGTQAGFVEGTDDLRGLPLNRLCDLIAAAKLVISPASGPALLSGLCGTPYLCWTDGGYRAAVRERDDVRTRGSWNPLDTPCTVLVQKDWKPDPGVLLHHANEMLRKRR